MKLATSCPKPAPKQKSPRKPMKKSRKKTWRRSAEDYARIYGSKERAEWVKSQPCAWCVLRGRTRMCGRSENAHTENEGMSRKGHYTTIVPLGKQHHDEYDNYASPFDTFTARATMRWLAELTEEKWQAFKTTQTVKGDA